MQHVPTELVRSNSTDPAREYSTCFLFTLHANMHFTSEREQAMGISSAGERRTYTSNEVLRL